MRFCTYTLGCKANQYDSQTIERLLCERGFEHVKLGDGADICIINTCAVTAESVRKSKHAVRRIKKNEPFSLIAVCGCFSELEPDVAKELDVDIIGGVKDREAFVEELLEKFQQSHTILNSTTGSITNTSINPISTTATTPTITTPSTTAVTTPTATNLSTPSPTQRTRALLKIQDGCDNYCTYCIIPFARGESRSIPLEELKKQAKDFEQNGYKEIIITGIEITSYKPSLFEALSTIQNAAPNTRLRLGSLDPSCLTKAFIKDLSKIPNVCNHFHISLQSGCDDVLKRMGRSYKTESLLEAIQNLRELFPDCAITADLIIGFPGETENEFAQTIDFIKKAKFADMHTFPYSKRAGTKAAEMVNQIDKIIKTKRKQIVNEIALQMKKEFQKSQIGKTVQVVFEQYKDGYSFGHSANYLEIAVKEKIPRNSLKDVVLTEENI